MTMIPARDKQGRPDTDIMCLCFSENSRVHDEGHASSNTAVQR